MNNSINEIKSYVSNKVKKAITEALHENKTDHRCIKAIKAITEGINNDNYTHFAVSKATGKIVNGWDYNGYDPSELNADKNYFFKTDLIDYGFNPKNIKILTLKGLKKEGIDPNDDNNWSNGFEDMQESNSKTMNIIKESIKRAVKQKIKEEIEDNYGQEKSEEAIDFYSFYDILNKNGWSFSDSYDVSSEDGKRGVRFEVNADRGKKSSSFDELIRQLKNASNYPDKILTAIGTHRYAPEIKRYSIVVLS